MKGKPNTFPRSFPIAKVSTDKNNFPNVICQLEKSEMKALQIFLTEKKRIQ